MKQYWKKDDVNKVGDTWHSHKLDNGGWCNGNPAREASAERPELEAKVLASISVKLDILTRKVDETLKRADWLYRYHPKKAPERSKSSPDESFGGYGPDTTGYDSEEDTGHVENPF